MRDKSESTYGEKKRANRPRSWVSTPPPSPSLLFCVFVFWVSNKNSNWPRHKKRIIFPRSKSGKKKKRKIFSLPISSWDVAHVRCHGNRAKLLEKVLAPFQQQQQQPVLFSLCVREKKKFFSVVFLSRSSGVCVCGVWTHLAAFLDTSSPPLFYLLFCFVFFFTDLCVCVCVCLLELL